MIHVFRISALNDKDTSVKLILPWSIQLLLSDYSHCFGSRIDPLEVWSEHTEEQRSVTVMGLLPLHHFPSTFGLNPPQILLFAREFCIILFHVFAASFHPRWTCLLYAFLYSSLSCYCDQGAKILSDKTRPIACRKILGTRKYKHLETITHAEIFFRVSRNLSGKAIDLYFNILTRLTQKTENHLKLFCLWNFYYLQAVQI